MRQLVINMILSTDMSKHFNLINQFIKQKEQQETLESESIASSTLKTELDQEFMETSLNLLMHTADYFGNAQKFNISRVWSERINEEFIVQYQEEEEEGLPLTNYYKGLDYLLTFSKNEIGFINYIVLPLYILVDNFMENQFAIAIQNINDNLNKWNLIKETQEEFDSYEYFRKSIIHQDNKVFKSFEQIPSFADLKFSKLNSNDDYKKQ